MSVAEPPADTTDAPGAAAQQDAGQAHAAAPDAGPQDLLVVPDLGLTALLASDQAGNISTDMVVPHAEVHAYDGHVALALDPAVPTDIDSTLDLLTTSHHLFDVPAMDIAVAMDDGMAT
jgi:hypothetical protein